MREQRFAYPPDPPHPPTHTHTRAHLARARVTHVHDGIDLGDPLSKLADPVGHGGEGDNDKEGPGQLLHLAQVACAWGWEG